MAKKQFASTPHVPAKKIAGKNPYPGPVIGMDVTTLVPHKAPRITGFAGTKGYGRLKMGPGHHIGKR